MPSYENFTMGEKKKIMYAVFRKPTSKFPDSIEKFAKDARWIVRRNKSYSWGKKSFYKRVEVNMTNESVYEVTEHFYKRIKK